MPEDHAAPGGDGHVGWTLASRSAGHGGVPAGTIGGNGMWGLLGLSPPISAGSGRNSGRLRTQGEGDKGYGRQSWRWRRSGTSAAVGPSAPARCDRVRRADHRGAGRRGYRGHRIDRTPAGLPRLGRRPGLRIRGPAGLETAVGRPRGRGAPVQVHPDGEPADARPAVGPGRPAAPRVRAGPGPAPSSAPRSAPAPPRASRRMGPAAPLVPARAGQAQLVRRVPIRTPFPRGGGAGGHPDPGHDGVRRRGGGHRRRERQRTTARPRRRPRSASRPPPWPATRSPRPLAGGASARRSAG